MERRGLTLTEKMPLTAVLPGMVITPLPEDHVPLEAVFLVKVLDADGHPIWLSRYTSGLSQVEVIGALITQSDLERHDYREGWEDEGD